MDFDTTENGLRAPLLGLITQTKWAEGTAHRGVMGGFFGFRPRREEGDGASQWPTAVFAGAGLHMF
jgi:hypothetical protein